VKQKILLPILLFTNFIYSQSRAKTFNGKVIDSFSVVKNAHIINLKTKKGTYSNDNGLFTIIARENDSLQISSIGYKTKVFTVKKFYFSEKVNFIFLEDETYTLNEIVLKRHELSGFLSLDLKKTPVDRREEIVKELVSDIKKMSVYEISNMGISANEAYLIKASIIRLPNHFEGAGISATSAPSNQAEKNIIKKLEEENKIIESIFKEFGENFFFVELKIPKSNYHHFVSYCSLERVVKLYKENTILKIIQLFKNESPGYLKSIKEK
jgi:hypothetical protein